MDGEKSDNSTNPVYYTGITGVSVPALKEILETVAKTDENKMDADVDKMAESSSSSITSTSEPEKSIKIENKVINEIRSPSISISSRSSSEDSSNDRKLTAKNQKLTVENQKITSENQKSTDKNGKMIEERPKMDERRSRPARRAPDEIRLLSAEYGNAEEIERRKYLANIRKVDWGEPDRTKWCDMPWTKDPRRIQQLKKECLKELLQKTPVFDGEIKEETKLLVADEKMETEEGKTEPVEEEKSSLEGTMDQGENIVSSSDSSHSSEQWDRCNTEDSDEGIDLGSPAHIPDTTTVPVKPVPELLDESTGSKTQTFTKRSIKLNQLKRKPLRLSADSEICSRSPSPSPRDPPRDSNSSDPLKSPSYTDNPKNFFVKGANLKTVASNEEKSSEDSLASPQSPNPSKSPSKMDDSDGRRRLLDILESPEDPSKKVKNSSTSDKNHNDVSTSAKNLQKDFNKSHKSSSKERSDSKKRNHSRNQSSDSEKSQKKYKKSEDLLSPGKKREHSASGDSTTSEDSKRRRKSSESSSESSKSSKSRSKEKTSDKKTSDEKTSRSKTSGEKTSDKRTSDGKTSESKTSTSNKKTSEGKTSDKKTSDEKTSGSKTSTSNKQTLDEKTSRSSKTLDEKTSRSKTSDEKTSDSKTSDKKTSDSKSSSSKSLDKKTSAEKTSESKISTSNKKTSDEKTSESKTSDSKNSESKTSDSKTSVKKTSELKTSTSKTSDEKTSDSKPSTSKTSDEKNSDSKTSNSKTSDEKTSESKTSDPKTSDSKTSETDKKPTQIGTSKKRRVSRLSSDSPNSESSPIPEELHKKLERVKSQNSKKSKRRSDNIDRHLADLFGDEPPSKDSKSPEQISTKTETPADPPDSKNTSETPEDPPADEGLDPEKELERIRQAAKDARSLPSKPSPSNNFDYLQKKKLAYEMKYKKLETIEPPKPASAVRPRTRVPLPPKPLIPPPPPPEDPGKINASVSLDEKMFQELEDEPVPYIQPISKAFETPLKTKGIPMIGEGEGGSEPMEIDESEPINDSMEVHSPSSVDTVILEDRPRSPGVIDELMASPEVLKESIPEVLKESIPEVLKDSTPEVLKILKVPEGLNPVQAPPGRRSPSMLEKIIEEQNRKMKSDLEQILAKTQDSADKENQQFELSAEDIQKISRKTFLQIPSSTHVNCRVLPTIMTPVIELGNGAVHRLQEHLRAKDQLYEGMMDLVDVLRFRRFLVDQDPRDSQANCKLREVCDRVKKKFEELKVQAEVATDEEMVKLIVEYGSTLERNPKVRGEEILWALRQTRVAVVEPVPAPAPVIRIVVKDSGGGCVVKKGDTLGEVGRKKVEERRPREGVIKTPSPSPRGPPPAYPQASLTPETAPQPPRVPSHPQPSLPTLLPTPMPQFHQSPASVPQNHPQNLPPAPHQVPAPTHQPPPPQNPTKKPPRKSSNPRKSLKPPESSPPLSRQAFPLRSSSPRDVKPPEFPQNFQNPQIQVPQQVPNVQRQPFAQMSNQNGLQGVQGQLQGVQGVRSPGQSVQGLQGYPQGVQRVQGPAQGVQAVQSHPQGVQGYPQGVQRGQGHAQGVPGVYNHVQGAQGHPQSVQGAQSHPQGVQGVQGQAQNVQRGQSHPQGVQSHPQGAQVHPQAVQGVQGNQNHPQGPEMSLAQLAQLRQFDLMQQKRGNNQLFPPNQQNAPQQNPLPPMNQGLMPPGWEQIPQEHLICFQGLCGDPKCQIREKVLEFERKLANNAQMRDPRARRTNRPDKNVNQQQMNPLGMALMGQGQQVSRNQQNVQEMNLKERQMMQRRQEAEAHQRELMASGGGPGNPQGQGRGPGHPQQPQGHPQHPQGYPQHVQQPQGQPQHVQQPQGHPQHVQQPQGHPQHVQQPQGHPQHAQHPQGRPGQYQQQVQQPQNHLQPPQHHLQQVQQPQHHLQQVQSPAQSTRHPQMHQNPQQQSPVFQNYFQPPQVPVPRQPSPQMAMDHAQRHIHLENAQKIPNPYQNLQQPQIHAQQRQTSPQMVIQQRQTPPQGMPHPQHQFQHQQQGQNVQIQPQFQPPMSQLQLFVQSQNPQNSQLLQRMLIRDQQQHPQGPQGLPQGPQHPQGHPQGPQHVQQPQIPPPHLLQHPQQTYQPQNSNFPPNLQQFYQPPPQYPPNVVVNPPGSSPAATRAIRSPQTQQLPRTLRNVPIQSQNSTISASGGTCVTSGSSGHQAGVTGGISMTPGSSVQQNRVSGGICITPASSGVTGVMKSSPAAFSGTSTSSPGVRDLSPGNYPVIPGFTPAVAAGRASASPQGQISPGENSRNSRISSGVSGGLTSSPAAPASFSGPSTSSPGVRDLSPGNVGNYPVIPGFSPAGRASSSPQVQMSPGENSRNSRISSQTGLSSSPGVPAGFTGAPTSGINKSAVRTPVVPPNITITPVLPGFGSIRGSRTPGEPFRTAGRTQMSSGDISRSPQSRISSPAPEINPPAPQIRSPAGVNPPAPKITSRTILKQNSQDSLHSRVTPPAIAPPAAGESSPLDLSVKTPELETPTPQNSVKNSPRSTPDVPKSSEESNEVLQPSGTPGKIEMISLESSDDEDEIKKEKNDENDEEKNEEHSPEEQEPLEIVEQPGDSLVDDEIECNGMAKEMGIQLESSASQELEEVNLKIEGVTSISMDTYEGLVQGDLEEVEGLMKEETMDIPEDGTVSACIFCGKTPLVFWCRICRRELFCSEDCGLKSDHVLGCQPPVFQIDDDDDGDGQAVED